MYTVDEVKINPTILMLYEDELTLELKIVAIKSNDWPTTTISATLFNFTSVIGDNTVTSHVASKPLVVLTVIIVSYPCVTVKEISV